MENSRFEYVKSWIRVPERYNNEQERELFLDCCVALADYKFREFETEPSPDDYMNFHQIGLAYTTLGEKEEHDIEVFLDLIDRAIIRQIDHREYDRTDYATLQELFDREIKWMDFNDLVRVNEEFNEEMED